MTNYEKIKQMSIEEMKEWLLQFAYAENLGFCEKICPTRNCFECEYAMEEWLNSEVIYEREIH